MNEIWFTSDTHFFHKNVIKLCNRPFSCIDEMHTTLIENWNKYVKPNDIIYFLGDFAFSGITKTLNIFNQLQGSKFLILGNHDPFKIHKKIPWNDVRDVKWLKNEKLFLSHYPHLSWKNSCYGSYHFYGHVHGKLEKTELACDVGVDKWNYMPVSLEMLKEYLKSQ